jgi:Kef-type K+ transport system membrane component KefB
MVPRGEVGIIVANAGEKAGAVDAETFAVIVAMSILTTLIVPPVLKVLFADRLAGRRAGRGGSPVPAD